MKKLFWIVPLILLIALLWIPRGPALPPGLTLAQINNPTSTSSNPFLAPDGSSSAPGISFSASTGTGIDRIAGNGDMRLVRQGAEILAMTSTGPTVNGSLSLQLCGNGFSPCDVAFYRPSANVVGISTGGTSASAGFLQMGTTVVASLPAAAAGNKGQMIYVSDSTSVASEGQLCVGSSTNAALAFSDGTKWKCF